MRMKFTFFLTLIGIGISLFHYLGYDPNNIIFYSLSVPAWFIPITTNIHNVHVFYIYILTIASWAILGYIIDRLIQNREKTHQNKT